MPNVFVVQNQHGQYLSKQFEWTDGSDRRALYRTAHYDEAVNVIFEQSSKDIMLRAVATPCETDEQNQPQVEICRHNDAVATPAEHEGPEQTLTEPTTDE
ncbi:hypothetical protein HCU74_08995 [Spongiibacter sp. KMU-166]|uniref:Uncharacterized protein n=1 Tax=Spongiibacter thalassae TaxID=2721624 RepID=A0ABX1GGI7_9GAMM|nr:hypothetical protein [Spongiibacter thalassae]NKI17553.1 hypothetical protein [Spongiibacter thalassae]